MTSYAVDPKRPNVIRLNPEDTRDAQEVAIEEARALVKESLSKGAFFRLEKSETWKVSGIYFLYYKKELQYVGQSISVFSRVAEHECNKRFDEVRLFACSQKDLDKFERFFIRLLQPPLNVAGKAVDGSGRSPWGRIFSLDSPAPPAAEE